MANLGSLIFSIGADTSRLRAAQREVESVTRNMQQRFGGLGREIAVAFGSVGAIAGLVKSLKEGINAVDRFKLATIGIAATLVDMAKDGSGDLKAIYKANLDYAERTYREVELAAARYFASGREMVEAWQILTQKGVIITSKEDIDNLGIIVDRIKLATQGQAASLQIAQEIRAVMSGQARMTDQMAKMLQDRLGPAWEEQLNKAREEGRVLEWLASQFKGLRVASDDITKTYESQKSTLGTLVTQIGRGGLEGAYRDIVSVLSDINGYLTDHRDELVPRIRDAWDTLKKIVTDPDVTRFFTTILKGAGEGLSGLITGLRGVAGAMKEILSVFNSFPPEVVGAAGTGILMRILTGSNTLAGVVAAFQVGLGGLRDLAKGMEEVRVNTSLTEAEIDAKMERAKQEYLSQYPGQVPPGFEGRMVRKPIPKPDKYVPQISMPKVSDTAAGTAAKALGLEAIDQQMDRFHDKIQGMYKELSDLNYDFWSLQAKNSGHFFQAEGLEISKWVEGSIYAIEEQVAEGARIVRETMQKLMASKGGATPEAWAGWKEMSDKQVELERAASEKKMAIWRTEAEKWKELQRAKLQGAAELAQVRLEYLQLKGGMQEQLKAQMDLINASEAEKMINVNKDIPGLVEAYKALFQAQRDAVSSNNSFWEGMKEGFKDAAGGMETLKALGKGVAQDLSSGFKDVFKSLITGSGDVTEKLANMFDKLADKLMDFALSDMWNVLSGKQSALGSWGNPGGMLSSVGEWLGIGKKTDSTAGAAGTLASAFGGSTSVGSMMISAGMVTVSGGTAGGLSDLLGKKLTAPVESGFSDLAKTTETSFGSMTANVEGSFDTMFSSIDSGFGNMFNLMSSGGGGGGFSLGSLFGGGGGLGSLFSGGSSGAGGFSLDSSAFAGDSFGFLGGGFDLGMFGGFAEGGIADRPTLSWVAEGGVPEAFVPIPSGKIPVDIRGGATSPELPTPEINVYNPGPSTKVTMRWRESSGQKRASAARAVDKARRDV